MKRQSTSKLLRLMVAVFALFLLVMAGSVLSACGGSVEEQPNNAEVHKHTYGAAEHTAIAKCGSTGYDVYTCTVCGDKYAIVTAATGEHDFKNGVCTVCGISTTGYDDTSLKEYLKTELDKINESVGKITTPEAAHKHKFDTTVKTIAPTCLSIGLTVKKCECGSTTVEDLKDPLKHEYEAKETVAATCTTDGKTEMVCKNCNDTYWAVNKDDPAKGHDFKRELADKSLDKPANCITPALRAYKCANCDEVDYQQFGDLDSSRHTNDETENKWVKDWADYTADSTVSTDTLPAGWGVSTSTLKVQYGTCEACGGIAWRQTHEDCEHEWTAYKGSEGFPGTIDRTCEQDGWFNAVCTKCGAFANQAPDADWDGKYETLNDHLNNEEDGPINVVLGDGDDTVEETKAAHKGLYKYEKTGHKYGNNLEENWEVDRDKDGKVITGSESTDGEGKRKTSNTTHWFSTTCENCNREIVVAQGKGENGADIAMYLLKDKNQKPLIDDDYYKEVKSKVFSREWHSWQLYNGKPETEGKIVFDNGVSINIPTDARGPVEATCLDEGVEWYYCIDDQCRLEGNGNGRWIEIELPALGHIWEKIDIDKNPTCTTGGKITYICTRTNGVTGKEESRCGHNSWDGEGKEDVTYDKDWATITFEYDEDKFDEVIKGKKKADSDTEYEVDPFNWNYEWRKVKTAGDDDTAATYTWEDEYYTVWGAKDLWTATCGTTKDIKAENPSVTTNPEGTEENGECGADVLNYFTNADGSMKHEFLEKFMPQAHLWDVDQQAMEEKEKQTPSTCYDGHVTIYKCVCKMNSDACCKDGTGEGAKACPKWNRPGKLDHLTKTDEDGHEIDNTATFTIYGVCGTNHTAQGGVHKNYTVTYCIYCYTILSVEATGKENFRHFPFDREKLYGLMLNAAPVKGVKLDALMEDPTLLAEKPDAEGIGSYKDYQLKSMVDARKEFVEAWKGIENYWFNKNGTASENKVINFVTLRDGNLECFDCYNHLDAFNTADEIMALAEAYKYENLSWALYYYVKGEDGQMIRVTEDNMKTFNACEYQYYSQYKIWFEENGVEKFSWYSSMRDMTNTEWGNNTGDDHKEEEAKLLKQILGSIGKYTEESVDKDGKAVEPTGKHYLVPAKDYSDKTKHPNFAKHEDGSVTMDWVCVFCGNTFELNVKLADVPATTDTATQPKVTDVILVTPDETKVLLVDLLGVKFESDLNERSKDSSTLNNKTVFQKKGPIYGQDTKDSSLATNKNGKWKYLAEGTVIIVEAHGGNGICVTHRETNGWQAGTEGADYFEGTDCWGATTEIGDKLNTTDFVDPAKNKTVYENIWKEVYSTAGIKAEDDFDGSKRLAVATRLDNLLREGGEIVVGGDLQELRKKAQPTNVESNPWKWDTITPAAAPMTVDAAATPTEIFPLATISQKENATYCFNAGKFKVGTDESKETEIDVPVLFLNDGTELDLNGHTIYANIWVGAVDDKGADVGFGDDGYGHTMTAGDVTIKNGTIIMSPYAKIQVEGKDAHLTLENVEISGASDGIQAYNGATITIKDSNLITEGFALSSNNCLQTTKNDGAAGQGSANFELENSAFISTNQTAFFMSAKGNITAKDCEFYGYDMGVYLRGHDLEEKAAEGETKATHATFENCLFAKGDQSSGADKTDQGTNTKHYGALTIGNDNANDTNGNYGSIKHLVLKNCDFDIVKVAKIPTAEETAGTPATGAWTPAFDENDNCDLGLGEEGKYDSTCTTDGEHACTKENCCHRAIVLNIYGCSKLNAEGGSCMNGNNVCTETCQSQEYGRIGLYLDQATFDNLVAHARKFFKHKGQAANGTINPFLECTFTDSAELLGKCMKLEVFLISETEQGAEKKVELNWTVEDGKALEMTGAGA